MTLDALGNWRRSWTELDASGTFDDATERDDRTHDLINRIVGRTLKGQGPSGADLSLGNLQYDLASNLSLWKRQGGTSAVDIESTHDAWNRLVDVSVGGVLRAKEAHNALHWRTYRFGDVRGTLGATPDLSPDGTLDQARLMHYGQDWRLLEERVDDDFDFDGWKAGTFAPGDIDRVQQYVWGLRYVDDIVLHRIDANNDGDYADAGDSTWYHLTDAQFSTVAIVRPNGAVSERASYSAYGNARHQWAGDVNGDGAVVVTGGGAGDDLAAVTAASGSTIAGGSPYRAEYDLDRDGDVDAADQALVGSAKAALPAGQLSPVLASGPDNPVGWDGYLYSPECALYEARFRVYEPGLGRWIERDCDSIALRCNLYCALDASPIGRIDPDGWDAWEISDGKLYKDRSDEERAKIRKGMKDCVVRKLQELRAAQLAYEKAKQEWDRLTAEQRKGKTAPTPAEAFDCADSALTMFVRCAKELKLPARFYAGGKWHSHRDYKNLEEFEKALREGLGALNLMDEQNTRAQEWKDLEPGDLLLWDLRAHGQDAYKGHTAVVTAKKQCGSEQNPKPCWEVIEGHLRGPLGTGTYNQGEAERRWSDGPLWHGTGRHWNWPDVLQ